MKMETQKELVKPNKVSDSYLFYLQFPLATIMAYVCIYIINMPWITIFVVYGLIPWLDGLITKDEDNPSQEEIKQLQDDWKFKISLYLSIIVDWISVFHGVGAISRGQKGYIDIIPMLFLLVNIGATGFVVAHELFHRLDKVDRFIGTVHMLKNLYLHLTIQHIYGHHKRVATPEDGATAPRGMSIYQFFPRAIYKIYCSAYEINPLFVSMSTFCYFITCFGVYKLFGFLGLMFFLLVALGSVFYLQTTSYIEHYGLLRKKLPNGQYQPVNRKCSWDSNNRISNYLLFKLQRHSDHHQNHLKPYQNLCFNSDAPQLPHGYIVCILMAFFPSVWFQTMNPLLDEYNKGEDGNPSEALKKAQEKARQFVRKSLIISGSFMVGEIIAKLVL